MGGTAKYKREEIEPVAKEIKNSICGTELIEIYGSIRRKKEKVGDIEKYLDPTLRK